MADLELNWALDVILWFQAWRVPIAEALGTVLHYLGSEDFYLIILPFIYWCVDAAFGRRLAVLFMLSSWNNSWFKAWFKRPRPFMVSDRVHPVVMETGYGLPSGHSQGTTTLWGAVALQARKRWVTIAVAVYIVLMILSRMSLGVH
nr:phosphatase PAP2 family protein [Anaerolineae bacterium]